MDLHKLRGFFSVVRYNGFTNAARRLHLSQPAVSLQVQSLERELGLELLDRASKRIVLTDPEHPGLEARPVLPYEMVLVTPRDHPLASRRRVSLADIASYPFISYTRDSETHQLIDAPFRKRKLRTSVRMALGSTDLIIKYVSLGYGVAIIHNLNIDEANRENLHARPLSRHFRREYVHLIHRRGEQLSPAAAALIELF